MASPIRADLVGPADLLQLVLKGVLSDRPLSHLLEIGVSAVEVANTISALRAIGYLESSSAGLRVTASGRKAALADADDPANPWLQGQAQFKLAPNERSVTPKLGRRELLAIRKRVSDQAG